MTKPVIITEELGGGLLLEEEQSVVIVQTTEMGPSSGSGGGVAAQPLTVTSNGQSSFAYTVPIANPAASWLEVNHGAYAYGVDYLLNNNTLTLTWQGPFALELTDQINLYSH
jgi:hypothetical protein